jgi:hypothetical protein
MIRLVLKRIFRRIKYIFLFRNLFWVNESCKDCGHCFRIAWLVKDEIWEKVMNDKNGGSLCIDCFIERAEKKNIELSKEDFNIEVFLP